MVLRTFSCYVCLLEVFQVYFFLIYGHNNTLKYFVSWQRAIIGVIILFRAIT